MKMRRILAVMLAALMLLSFAACSKTDDNGGNGSKTDDTTEVEDNEVKMKFLKAGRSTCIIIRTPSGNIMIDAAADDKTDKIITYLAEKEITEIDYLIITNYSKKHIGGIPTLLSYQALKIKNVIVPSYTKSSSTYDLFANAISTAGITPTTVTENTELTLGDVKIGLYVAHKDYSTADDENDESNSMAVTVSYGEKSFLMTSRIKGERVTELLTDLGGKTFDLITVPNYGIYDSAYDNLFTALGAKYAVAFCTNNSEKTQMDVKTIAELTEAKTLVYATRDGSVEVKMTKTGITVNGTPINSVD